MSEALEQKCRDILKRMVKESINGKWEGSTTRLILARARSSEYSRILEILTASGAISQERRGGGTKPSIWRILEENPSFENIPTTIKVTEAQREKSLVMQRIEALEKLVGGVNVPKALSDLQIEMRARELISGMANDTTQTD